MINGLQSARLIHQAASSRSFKQTISVDRKYRSEPVQLSLQVRSSASNGNLTLLVTDETNSATIAASQPISTASQIIASLVTNATTTVSGFSNSAINGLSVGMTVTGSGIPTGTVVNAVNTAALTITLSQAATASATVSLNFSALPDRRVFSFTIPASCASLSYTITALQEANLPESYIDDVVIELASTALLSTSVEVPNLTAWQGYTPTFQGFGTPSAVEFEWRQVGQDVEIRGKFTSGTPTAVEARVGLPGGLTSAGTDLIPSIQYAGFGVRSVVANNPIPLIEPSVTYVTFGRSGDTVIGLSKTNGSDLIGSGLLISFQAKVPCVGLSATSTKTIPLTQSGLIQNVDTTIRLDTANGYGSTATKVRRFTSIRTSIGSDVLYADSAVNGSSFTAVTAGVYEVSYSENMASGAWLGLSLNASSLSTNIESLSSSERLASTRTATSGGTCAWQGYLNAGDIIRPMTDGTAAGNNALVHFSISKQSSLKQVSVNPNSKMTLPSSELRMEGITGRGSTDTRVIQYSAISAIRGDAFTVASNSVNGTVITITKAGKISINANAQIAAGELFISKNQAVLTSNPLASETLGYSFSPSSADAQNVGFVGTVNVGDILRITSSSAPSASSGNLLTILHEETSIGVGVSNTLPQFSESDSCVRVVGANGYGSTNTSVRRFSSVDTNLGTDIVYTDSASLGGSFTVAVTGIYSISFSDTSNVSGTQSAISIQKNSTTFSQTADSTTLAMDNDRYNTNATIVRLLNASWTGTLVAGDVIRAVNDAANVNGASAASFTISKVGKPNVTGVDVTPFVTSTEQVTESSIMNTSVTIANAVVTGALTHSNNTSLYSYNASTGVYTILSPCTVFVSYSARKAASGLINLTINSSAKGVLGQSSPDNSTSGVHIAVSANFSGSPGETFSCRGNNGNNQDSQIITVTAVGKSPNIVTASEAFSTDTALLAYAGSAQYTLSTLANAPVGTFITFTTAANSNARTQTNAAAPTQATSSMNTNGIQLFARAYNAASTSGNPASIAIQIGKNFKGLMASGYSSTAKVNAISLDMFISSTTVQRGTVVTYEESTGILQIDCSSAEFSANTARSVGQDATGSAVSNGYIVINASKSPALTGVPLLQPRIATISDVKASGTDGGTATAGSYQTRTLNTLSDPTGIVTSLASNQFVLSKGEYYIEFAAPAAHCESHKAKLRNVTDSTDAIVGQSMYIRTAAGGDNSAQVTTQSIGRGTITISSPKTFEIQHRVAFTIATIGYGINCSFGDSEIYTQVQITKIKD
jgi:hypothetical protein